jgi:ABC-2 type transport system permease protein
MSELAGTSALVRLILRRDRVRLPLWLAGIGLLVVSSPSSVEGLYPTEADLAAAAEMIRDNAAVIALNGPAVGLETLGGRTVFEMGAFTFVLVALMNVFLVARHTRAEEESGRVELVRAAAVGRNAPITATLLVALLADALVAVLVTAGLTGAGLALEGSLAFAAAVAAVGLFFAAVTAVTAQVTEHTRLALGLASAVLGAAYVLRAAGDAGSGVLSWFSPIGWGQAIHAFAGERWWVLVLPLAGTLLLVALAFALAARRDVGSGLLRPLPGPPVASTWLARPIGLAMRLQRGALIGWAVGLFLGGAAYGSIGKDIEDFIGDNESLNDLIAQMGGSVVDSFFATTISILAIAGTGFAIQATMRLRSEESAGRAESVLATALSRCGWVGSHLVIAVVGSAVMLAAVGVGNGLTYGISIGDLGEIPRLTAAALAYLPAMWVLVGVTMLLYGLAPRAVLVAWGALAVCLVVGFLGQLLGLPEWVRNLSPFEHVPSVPAADFEFAPLLLLTAVAVALVAGGITAFRRRDITS